MNGKVVLKIDGRYVEASAEESILDVARRHGIFIPSLCHLSGLKPAGACRLCLVEVKGVPRLLPSCLTKVAQGMEVITNSPRLREHQMLILSMIFSERNHTCSVCVSNGHCELQDLAQKMGFTHSLLPYRYPRFTVDSSHDLYRLDHNRCVLCARCIRVCDQIEGAHTWDYAGRGIDTRVVADYNQPWGLAESCTSCSKCVHVCPTGALSQKGTSVAEMHKRRQFLPYLTLMRERWQ